MLPRKPKVHSSTPTTLDWPCLCLSFGIHLLLSSLVHKAAINANTEVLGTVPIIMFLV